MLTPFHTLLQTGAGGTDSLTAPGTATAADRAGSAFTTPHAHAPHSPAGPSQGGGQLDCCSLAFWSPEADGDWLLLEIMQLNLVYVVKLGQCVLKILLFTQGSQVAKLRA